jgi:bacillolysin
MRKLAFLALAVVAVGCSTDPEQRPTLGPASSNESVAPAITDPGVTASQIRSFGALQTETSRNWTWKQHDALKTPMHLSTARVGAPTLAKDAHVEAVTVDFVNKYRDLFKMADARAELAVTKSETDHLAMKHVRFQQVTHGVPVVGAELAAHYDAAGHITSIDANYIPGIHDLDLQPKIDAKAGETAALADIVARTKNFDESQIQKSDGKLVVYALDNHPATLAYEYRIRAVYGAEPAIWVVTVDAKTGDIIDRYNNLQTVEASGSGVLGPQTFQVTAGGTGYQMLDTSRGVQIRTYTAGGQEVGPAQGATVVSSGSLTSWDTGTGAGAAVDAHTYAAAVFDYYKKVHARNAIDGAGGAMLSTAHYGQAYDNAFWDGTGMSYGDGGQLFRPLSAGLDVVAHEFTHGVTEKTSNLIYRNQSGALNEAVSDIFGVFIEHAVKPDDTKNWTMGENIAKQAGLLRDFKNPAAGDQPANMKNFVNTQQDEGGVHINSGIINNAAFLMTMGGTNPVSQTKVAFGIGWEKSEKLWYRANTKYFLSSTNFAQAATATMQAAKDIGLTENEQNIVDCAYKAVGIVTGACGTITDPKATTTPQTTPGGGATDTPETPGGNTSTDETPDGEEAPAGTTTPKKKRAALGPQESAGCSMSSNGGTDLGPLAGLFAVVIGLAAGRRRKRG